MKKIKILFAIVLLSVAATAILTACGGASKDDLVGKWSMSGISSMTLKSDGSVTVSGYKTGTWDVSGDKIIFTELDGRKAEYTYKLDGNKLSFGGQTLERE